jgi:hypothetical protein
LKPRWETQMIPIILAQAVPAPMATQSAPPLTQATAGATENTWAGWLATYQAGPVLAVTVLAVTVLAVTVLAVTVLAVTVVAAAGAACREPTATPLVKSAAQATTHRRGPYRPAAWVVRSRLLIR